VLAGRGLLPDRLIDMGSVGTASALPLLLETGFASSEARAILERYATTLLAPLEAYDRGKESALVETLAAYLDAGATVAAAAQHLGVHRNTLSYRVARIEAVAGYALSDPATRFDLQLAIAIRRALTN
jgi:DNA-binding PucR family transcriptional regulator